MNLVSLKTAMLSALMLSNSGRKKVIIGILVQSLIIAEGVSFL